MKRLNGWFLVCLLMVAAVSGCSARDFFTKLKHSLEPDRLVVYKTLGERELKLHVFFPDGHKPDGIAPAFVVIHGGGWSNGDAQRFYPYAHGLLDKGYVGISVEYRLISQKGVSVFDCVKDGRAAIRYIRAHAGELGIDPQRIAVGGGSAGAHVAAGTALFDGVDHADEDLSVSCRPDALVLLFPVIDTSGDGYGQRKIGDDWKRLSPVDQVVAGLPPTIVFHGDADKITPYAGAVRFEQEMKKLGNICELVTAPGGNHGHINQNEGLFKDALVRTHAFLEKHMAGGN